jgi:hypothetical protein
MIIFGAPYYCLELYNAYTGLQPPDLVLALAGGAAVAPSSLDPWIFLLFWANWNQPANMGSSRRLVNISAQQKPRQKQVQIQNQPLVQVRRTVRSTTTGTSSSNDPRQHQNIFPVGHPRLPPYIIRWDSANKRQDKS